MKKGFTVIELFIVVVMLFVVLGIFGPVIKAIFFPVTTAVRTVDVAHGVMQQTLTPENAIREYEWFKQQEADIRRCLRNEQIAEEELKEFTARLPSNRSEWRDFDLREEASMRNSLNALRKVTTIAMEDYNAKSQMTNKSIFKDNLPSNISRSFYAGMNLIK